MKKKVLIHVGPPKTGTSAIQQFLSNNRKLLSENGVFYPAHELGDNGISSGNLHSILRKNERDEWQVDKNKTELLMNEFQNSSAHTLLLSSEYFFRLIEDISELIPTARFIAYIRCPLETFESSYNQSVKRHHKVDKASFGKHLHTTTLNMLTESVKLLGPNRFKLRGYLPVGVSNYNILDDFLTALELDVTVPSNEKTNTSYTLEALELKRWLNQFDLGKLDLQIDSQLQSNDFGTTHFSLLPESLLMHYQKQSFNNVREFVHTYRTSNGKALLAYLKNRSNRKCVVQSISDEQFEQICQRVCMANQDLYMQVCEKVQANRCQDIQQFDRKTLLLKYYKKKNSFFSRCLQSILKK